MYLKFPVEIRGTLGENSYNILKGAATPGTACLPILILFVLGTILGIIVDFLMSLICKGGMPMCKSICQNLKNMVQGTVAGMVATLLLPSEYYKKIPT